MVMNGEARNEDGEIKIDAGERSQAEGDGEKIQSVHGEIIGASERKSRVFAFAVRACGW